MVRFTLPAYNEEETLPPLLKSISSAMDASGMQYEVLVVNDGSTDGTARVAREAKDEGMPIRVIEHPRNMGLSAAIRTGLSAAAEESAPEDIIVTMDADNTHDPAQTPGMVQLIHKGYDVVIASRYQKGAVTTGVTPMRRLMSRGAGMLFRMMLPIGGVKDYTCGFRAYRASALKKMFRHYGESFIDQPGFSAMADILLKMRGHGFRFAEVPMTLRYDLKAGESKMRVGGTVFETLGLIMKRRFGRGLRP